MPSRCLRIQVACPAYTVTGGPEALHQLVHVSRQLGVDARIVYRNKRPDKDISPTADPFRIYDIQADDEIEDSPEVLLVVPETETELLKQHRKVRKAIWWLSIDNYWVAASTAKARRPDRWWKRRPPQPFNLARPDRSVIHLAQSEYARRYLQDHRIGNILMLTDYLRDDFLKLAGANVDGAARHPRIAYNPKKGQEITRTITERFAGEFEFVRIENMTPAQVIDVLRTSMVYMDFGHHPGRDRIPREAASCGCCVLTGRRGSAANSIDVPIPEAFKIDENSPHFLDAAGAALRKLTTQYEDLTSQFDAYRKIISDQKRLFGQEISALAAAVPISRACTGTEPTH